MPDILHDFPIAAPRPVVFAAVSTPAGLDEWWPRRSRGEPAPGADWEFFFGPAYDWRGRVTRFEADRAIAWELTRADADWTSTSVSIELSDRPDGLTWVRFCHAGWREAGEHYRVSTFCWAMYLRVMRRWLEQGERVAYDRRLEV